MDNIDLRDEILRKFLEYGIKGNCTWCSLKKNDLAECAETIVEEAKKHFKS